METLDGLDDAYIAKWLTEVARATREEVARQTARVDPFRTAPPARGGGDASLRSSGRTN
jgi:hypothetical protein